MSPSPGIPAFLLIAALGVPSAAAQTPPPGTTPAFVIESDSGDNRLQIGGFVQADGRFVVGDDQNNVTDTFLIRRFRSILQGRVARHFDFYFNVEFAGTVNIRDAYFDTRFSDAFRVRLGKGKVPVSYDTLIPDSNIMFVERGLTTTVAPDRDIGVQLLGDLAGNAVSYAVSLTNGVIDGGSGDADGNDGKDVAGRIVVRPWIRQPTSRLAGLGFAIAGNTGTQAGALPSFPSPARQIYFTYSGAVGDGTRTRWSPQAFYYLGPFGAYGEWIRSNGNVRKGGVEDEVTHEAWEAVVSWVLTGEAASDRNVRPKVNFNPPTGNWGALQVAARYHSLSVSQNAVTLGFAAPTASRTADAFTLGLNWYLNPFVKWNFNFERTVFDGNAQGPRHAERAILLRAQLGL